MLRNQEKIQLLEEYS